MRGNASRFQRKQPTLLDKRNSLIAFLCGANRAIRPNITLDVLARYGCDPKVTEYEFVMAQQRWAAEQ